MRTLERGDGRLKTFCEEEPPLPEYPDNRYCACGTRLSIYNGNYECFVCTRKTVEKLRRKYALRIQASKETVA